jgi:hypothetical protein
MADLTLTAGKLSAVSGMFGEPEVVNAKLSEAVTIGQAVYQTTTGFGVADANAAGKQQFRGIALETGGSGYTIGVLKRGAVEGYDLSGLANDAVVYLSDTAGALADAAGTMTVNVGRVHITATGDSQKALYVDADWLRTWA